MLRDCTGSADYARGAGPMTQVASGKAHGPQQQNIKGDGMAELWYNSFASGSPTEEGD